MTTPRARLQELGLDDLRNMAADVEIEADGLQKSKLIAAILDQVQSNDFRNMAEGLGMDVRVEVHDETELEKSLAAGSSLIGINNRNLRDFSVDLDTTFRLKREIPAHLPVVSESGIRNHDDMLRLQDNRITAALIGETLMRDNDPVAGLKKLLGN